jgi:hypothetical protein
MEGGGFHTVIASKWGASQEAAKAAGVLVCLCCDLLMGYKGGGQVGVWVTG